MRVVKQLTWFTLGMGLSIGLIGSAWADWTMDESEESAAPSAARALKNAAESEVPELRIRNLSEYRGQNVTVFYVSAREMTVGGERQLLRVGSIKAAPVTTQIDANGSATVPKLTVPRRGFDVFNFIVLVVHQQDRFFIRNKDGSMPKDPRIESGDMSQVSLSELEHKRYGYVAFPYAIDQLKSSQQSVDSIVLRAGSDF